MSWKEDYEARQRAVKEELDVLVREYMNKPEELDMRFLKNHGCLNFKTEAEMHEVELARAWHKICMEVDPEEHDLHEEEPYRCYHVTKCKCGFQEACDSSD